MKTDCVSQQQGAALSIGFLQGLKTSSLSARLAKALSLVMLLGLLAQPGLAFKPRTHVWIAQQVLNDVLLDGMITVNSHNYQVPPRTVEILRNHASSYRMGHIGPDAFPDILVGQTIVHPGRQGGWQTDNWLQWSLQQAGDNPEHVAYALGMLGHAAGDVFAHSYVNMYTGDIFSLSDGETDVEVRHIALETFIEKYTPMLRDHTGRDLGGVQDNISAPVGFLARHLILAGDPAREYQASRLGLHLVAMRNVRNAIFKAQASAEQASVSTTALAIRVENQALDAARKANELAGPIAQAKLSLNVAMEALRQHDRLIAVQQQLITEQTRLIRQAEATITDAGNQIAHLPGEIAKAQNDIVSMQQRVANTSSKVAQRTCEDVRRRVKKWGVLGWAFKWIVETTCTTVDIASPVYESLVKSTGDLIRQKNSLEATLQSAIAQQSIATAAKAGASTALAAASVEKARLEALKQADSAGQAAAATASEGLQQLERTQRDLLNEAESLKHKVDKYRLLVSKELNPVALALKNWGGDVDNAIEAYEKANFAVTKAFLSGGNALAPLQEWLSCWAPVFMAVPQEIPGTVCAVKHGIEEVRNLRTKLRQAMGPAGWLVDPAGMAEEILLTELTPALEDATIQVATLLNGNLGTLVEMHLKGIDAQQLNAIFNRDATTKQLLLIPDAAQRVLADMHVQNSLFDDQYFAPIYNAVLLAKLALLDASALNTLAKEAGISFPTAYGPVLYEAQPAPNALIGMVRSIDGNHQWQAFAPAYPRRSGHGDGQQPDYRRYGYSFADGAGKGMRFYGSTRAQEKAFNWLFRGPLSPALETPRKGGFTPALPNWYVAGTDKRPFPQTPNNGLLSRLLWGIFN